jgi:Ras-related protein Rab-21
MLGNLAVGKTSLVLRFVEGKFRSDFGPTIGANFLLKRLSFDSSLEVLLSIWDISGHFVHKPEALSRAFYQGSNGCLLICDLGRKDTLTDLASWKIKVQHYAPDIPMILLGNKNDLPSRVSDADLHSCAASLGVIDYCSTSAKTGDGVVESFHTMARTLLKLSGDKS